MIIAVHLPAALDYILIIDRCARGNPVQVSQTEVSLVDSCSWSETSGERDVMLLEIEKVFVTPAGEVCADAAGQRSRQGAEEPQQPESVSGNVLINVP